MIRDVVNRGLDDQEIQQDLLGDRNQEPCLEEVIQFVESKESGKRSAIRLPDSHAVAAKSRYHRSKKNMRLRRAIRHNSPAELPRSTARIQIPVNLAIIVVKGVMASVRCHRSEQLNVQLGERTVKTTQRRYSSPSVP